MVCCSNLPTKLASFEHAVPHLIILISMLHHILHHILHKFSIIFPCFSVCFPELLWGDRPHWEAANQAAPRLGDRLQWWSATAPSATPRSLPSRRALGAGGWPWLVDPYLGQVAAFGGFLQCCKHWVPGPKCRVWNNAIVTCKSGATFFREKLHWGGFSKARTRGNNDFRTVFFT